MVPSGTNTVKTQLWMSSPLTGQTSTAEARASVCLRGPKPHAASPPHAVHFIYSLVTCSPARVAAALAEAVSFPVPPLPLSADVTEVYLYLEGLLFSSVASVSCSSTGGFPGLCVRLFLAVGQLNLLGPERSCAPAELSKGSHRLTVMLRFKI